MNITMFGVSGLYKKIKFKVGVEIIKTDKRFGL